MMIMTVLYSYVDALAMPTGFCLLEKRICRRDNTVRCSHSDNRQVEKILEIKEQFENQIGCSHLFSASGYCGKQFSLGGILCITNPVIFRKLQTAIR